MKWSKYQKIIYKTLVEEDCNMLISAVAGSGKTTTLEHCSTIIPPKSSKIFLAFNNSIVKELKERITVDDIEITTMHSFCWRSLLRHYGYKIKLNKNKVGKHLKPILKRFAIPAKKHASYMFIMGNLSNLLRQNLINIKDIDAMNELADKYDYNLQPRDFKILELLIMRMDKDKKEMDFTDMIYRIVKDRVRLPKYDYIFVDEAQDLSKVQQTIISRIRKRKGRMIAVGDPAQAIYGFAGADNNAYNNLKTIFDNTIELPLSVNYRCGKRIVEEAQKINNQIEVFKGNHDGEVRNGFIKEIKNGDWVLCRNLKPLVELNMYFLHKRKKSFIKGIDIGANLANLVKRTGNATINGTIKSIEKDIEKARAKLRKFGVKNPDKTSKIDNMLQKLDIIHILSDDLTSSAQLVKRIHQIFKEQGDGIILSTIHKSKGLENNNIFILSPELIPNKFATQEWQIEQEYNLLYVAITRAKNKLIYIDKLDFKKIQIYLKDNL